MSLKVADDGEALSVLKQFQGLGSALPWPTKNSYYRFASDPVHPTTFPRSWWHDQLVKTCSCSSINTNKRCLPVWLENIPLLPVLFPLTLRPHILPKNCIMQLPDVPLSLASKCRLVVRRALSDTRPLTIAKLGKEEGGNHYFQVLARDSKTSSTSCPGTRPSLTHPTPLSRSHTEPWLLPARKHLQLWTHFIYIL